MISLASKSGQSAKVVKKKAQFYKMSGKGTKTAISRAEYQRLSQHYRAECVEVCTIFEDDDGASGPTITRVDGSARHARLTAGVRTAVPSQTRTQTLREETTTIPDKPVVMLGVTTAVPSQTRTQTLCEEIATVEDKPVAMLGVTTSVPSQPGTQAETPCKQVCIVADTQVVLPDVTNPNTSQKDQRAEIPVSLAEKDKEDIGLTALRSPIAPWSPHYAPVSPRVFSSPPQFRPRQASLPSTVPISLPLQRTSHWDSHRSAVHVPAQVTSKYAPLDRIENVVSFPNPHPTAFVRNTQNPQSLSVMLPSNKALHNIRSAYGADACLIIGPPVYLSGITFPAAPAPRLGTLVMPFRSAIRVAHDIYAHPAASPAASVPTLLRRGASHRVLSPHSQVIPVAPPTGSYPSYLDTRNTYREFLNLKDPNYWNVYLTQVQALLRRPYARRFLTLGGILWRLALQFGLPALLNHALAGPSSDIIIWGRGDVVNGQWDDSVTAADMATLIGLSGAESCWPPHDIWNAACRWKGFWSDADEQWFQSHLGNLSFGNTKAAKSRKDWKRFFRPIAAARSSDASIYGSEAFARELFGQLGFPMDRDPAWDLSVYG